MLSDAQASAELRLVLPFPPPLPPLDKCGRSPAPVSLALMEPGGGGWRGGTRSQRTEKVRPSSWANPLEESQDTTSAFRMQPTSSACGV